MKSNFFVCGFINNETPRNFRECETMQEAESYALQIMGGHWLINGNSSQIWINSEKAGRLVTVCVFMQTGTASHPEKIAY